MEGSIGTVTHESGLEFIPADRNASWAAGVKYPQKCWGTLLNRPQFKTAEELAEHAKRLGLYIVYTRTSFQKLKIQEIPF